MTVLTDRSVALVHEWFGATGGAEHVFAVLHDLIPHADPYVLWRDPEAEKGKEYVESWMARTPLRKSKALALPLMPLTWRTLTQKTYDVVLSSSHAFAHTVKLRNSPDAKYLSYVHSPARYVWSPDFDGRGSGGLLAAPRRVLQGVDRAASKHVHSYAANSHEVRKRIERFWRRDARVINPPVDVGFYSDAPAPVRSQNRDYLLGVGRFIPYKRFDLMMEIAQEAGKPLVIAGSGPEEERLRRYAEKIRTPLRIEVKPTRERLRELYWGAEALLFPAHEDFGIIPVEAMASGTPVLGLNRGGLTETVVAGETGFLIDEVDPRKYAQALRQVAMLDRRRIIARAGDFSTAAFHERIAEWITAEIDGGSEARVTHSEGHSRNG